MTSPLKIVVGLTSKNKYRKNMTIKIWLWKLDKCLGLLKSCLHVWFMLWVVNNSYNIVDMTRTLVLGFMHRL